MSEVAKYSIVELTLLVPKRWLQFNKMVNLEEQRGVSHRVLSVQPVTWGFSKNNMRNVTHIYPKMKRILAKIDPDIIEIWEEPFSAVTAHIIFWARRIVPQARIIFFSAQNILKKYPIPFSVFEKYTFKNSAHAFLMNDEVARVIKKKGYSKGFDVLPLGVDPEVFCKEDVSSLKKKLGIRDFVVGFIGKIAVQKGILDLIEAASQIAENIQLLIIGNGDLKEKVEKRVISSGLRQRTIIVDALVHSQVPEYLNCMDVLVSPSITTPRLKEQFGRVLIEAMACQVPVIGSSSGQIPATIGEAGLIFKEGNVIDLKEKIETLIRDGNLRTLLGKNGRKRVLKNFTWKTIAEKQYQAYTRLMNGVTCTT